MRFKKPDSTKPGTRHHVRAVPVMNSHSGSVTCRRGRRCRCRARGLLPPGSDAGGRDEVFVGRLRRDSLHERGLCVWIVSDNLREGAALNAIQICEALHERELVRARAAA